MRIRVFILFFFDQFLFCLKAITNIFIAVFYKSSLIIRNFSRKLTFSINRFNIWNTTALKYKVIVFTKSRRNMNNSSTIFCRNIGSIEHSKCTFTTFLLRNSLTFCRVSKICKIREKRLIISTNKIFTLTSINYFIVFWIFVIRTKTSFCKNIEFSAFFIQNLYIINIRPHTKTKVRRQSPWSCCPGNKVSFAVCHVGIVDCCRSFCNLKTNSNSCIFYIFIALSKFMSRKNSCTARTIRKNIFSFINKTFVPE